MHYDSQLRPKFSELIENQNCRVKDKCKIKEADVKLVHDGKKSHVLWSVAKVEKSLLSKGNKVQSATIKYFINGKPVVIIDH